MSELSINQIVGLPQAHGWSQVSTNQTQNLVCSFAVSGPQAKNFGREISDLINQAEIGSPVEFHHFLLDLIKKTREAKHQLQIAAALFSQKNELEKMTLAAFQGEVWLKRKGQQEKLGKLVGAKTELKMVSGSKKINDCLILMTADSSQKITNKKNWTKKIDFTNQADSCLCAVATINIQKTTPAQPTQSHLPKTIGHKIKKPRKLPKLPKVNFTQIIFKLATKLKKLIKKIKKFIISQPKKKLARTSLIILLILSLGGGLLYWQQQKKQKATAQIKSQLEPAAKLLEEAKNQKDSNLILSREKTAQAISFLEEKLNSYQQSSIGQKLAQEQLKQARQLLDQISGQSELEQLEVFFDLTKISPSFLATQAEINQQSLFFLDQGQRKLIKLDLNSKQSESLDLESEVEPKDLVATDESIFILGNGIFELKLQDWTTNNSNTESQASPSLTQIKQQGDSTREASLIDHFQSYLYVLNAEQRNIYRFIDRGGELSEPIGWLTNKQGLEFNQLQDLAINGFVWLADQQGSIYKFFQGEPADFNPSGLPNQLGNSLHLFTHPELEQLYILDNDNQRVIVLDEEGRFISQVESPALAGATKILVTPSSDSATNSSPDVDSGGQQQKQVFAISGSIVYQLKP